MPRNPFGLPQIKTKPIDWLGTGSKSKAKCPSTMRNKIRKRWWGADTYRGNCFCCGESVDWANAQVGGIQAGAYGGLYTPENSRLVCGECNRGMGKTNMKIYMKRNYPERYEKTFPKSVEGTRGNIRRKKTRKTETNPFGIRMPKFRF